MLKATVYNRTINKRLSGLHEVQPQDLALGYYDFQVRFIETGKASLLTLKLQNIYILNLQISVISLRCRNS